MSRLWKQFLEFIDAYNPADEANNAQAKILEAVNLQKNAAALAMTQADQAHKALEAKMSEINELNMQAKQALEAGNENLAKKILQKRILAEKEITGLTKDYESAQAVAESTYNEFRRSYDQARANEQILRQIENDIVILNLQERAQKVLSAVDVDGQQAEVDKTLRDIQTRKGILSGLQTLEASLRDDSLQREVDDFQGKQALERAMANLRKQTGIGEIIDAEFSELSEDDDPITKAQKALNSPRFQQALRPGNKQPVKEG